MDTRESKKSGPSEKGLRWLTSAMGVVLCMFFLVALWAMLKVSSKRSAAVVSLPAASPPLSQAPTPTPPPPTPPAPKIEPLQFTSSRRLATKLRGFTLGMSLSEAIALNAGLKTPVTGERPSPEKLNSWLEVRNVDGFEVDLLFAKGRLVNITASILQISPQDAQAFFRDTLLQLGNPDARIRQRFDSSRWVWIDGDVRTAFVDSSGADGARCIELTMTVYPALIGELKASGADTLAIESKERAWGALTGRRGTNELPEQLFGLQLKMQPWQVRSVLPGIEIHSSPESAMADYHARDGTYFSLWFWRGMLKTICVEQRTSTKSFPELRSRLLKEYGDPLELLSSPSTQALTWENQQVSIGYTLKTRDDPNETSALSVCIEDIALAQEMGHAQVGRKPAQFKPAPENKSFF